MKTGRGVEIRPGFWRPFGVALTVAVFVGFAGMIATLARPAPPLWAFAALGVVGLAITVYAWFWSNARILRLHDDRIEIGGLKGSRILRLSEVEGGRSIDGGILLVTRRARDSVTLPYAAQKRPEVAAWLQQVPNLDYRDYEAELDQARADPTLGADTAARERTIERLNRISRHSYWPIMILFFWVGIAPFFYPYAVLMGLAAPVVAMLLVLAKPNLFVLFPINTLGTPIPLLGLMIVGAALALRGMFDVELIDWQAPLVVAGLAAAATTVAAMGADRSLRHPLAVGMTALVLFAWSWGVAVLGNAYRDSSGVLNPLTVQSVGRDALRATTAGGERISLDAPGFVLKAVREGRGICLMEQDGRFGWRHRSLVLCEFSAEPLTVRPTGDADG